MVILTLLLSAVVSNAQISNAKTETVKVYGNCGMCEATIEKAGSLKKVAEVDWDQDTKIATFTYDVKKISQDEILKKIAFIEKKVQDLHSLKKGLEKVVYDIENYNIRRCIEIKKQNKNSIFADTNIN